ncbi:VIT1/CCC1 transporter family protein [Pelagimonas varians]|uniref:VIT family protein n=1 Tax=Pelagimonas varians TaxID=696760 RepID=A0A238K102_9RHOB|nr:VIT1/CCC1 transporter family protein [Pelagimonas varians]PYG33393.1 VIT1/CCC1 family predicted Fe2+/Mn2+ transporter [Pelagimonas varians]SMX36570.1 VIT family protein [Pelagimonas varians]
MDNTPLEHGHSQKEIDSRLAQPPGRGDLRDVVYGAIDGSVTTFAIVAGVAGAGLSPFIIVALGVANVLADGFSMAAGNYSATKAELDDIQRLRCIEERHIKITPEGERRELRSILAQKGLSGRTLEDAVDQMAANREAWIATMLDGEYGVAPVDPHPMRAALVTFGAFLIAGFIPLMPFLLGLESAFSISIWLTMISFFVIGTLKSVWSLSPWWRSGLETLAIGGAAASIAYVVGSLFHG